MFCLSLWLISVEVIVGAASQDTATDIRLRGGTNNLEGRVEIFHGDAWGTICDDHFDINDANVICRQLGFAGAEAAIGFAFFGPGNGSIFMDNLACTGLEYDVFECPNNGVGVSDCSHLEDAGVVCSAGDVEGETSGYKPLRLVDGKSDREGRVEVYHNGSWSTICDDRWDIRDAYVVCRQVGFYLALNATVRSSVFGRGEGNILYENSNCHGNEAYLNDCAHSAYGDHDCTHGEDAGVICSGPYLGTGGSSSNEDFDWSSHEGPSNTNTGTAHQPSFQSSSSSFSWEIQEGSVFRIDYGLQDGVPSSSSRPVSYGTDGSTSSGSAFDPCFEDKCENGATCIPDPKYPTEYICTCFSDWLGVYCEYTGDDFEDQAGGNESVILNNGTEEDYEDEEEDDDDEEELYRPNGTEEEVEPTNYSRIDEEFDQLDNDSTNSINSTTTAEKDVTLTSPAVTATTDRMTTTFSEGTVESSTKSLKKIVTMTTSDVIIIGNDVTGEDDAVTNTDVATTNIRELSEASIWNATADMVDNHVSVVTYEGTASTERGYNVTDIEKVTIMTQVLTSTEVGQLISITSNNNIASTTSQDEYATENGKSVQEPSNKSPTAASTSHGSLSPTTGHDFATVNRILQTSSKDADGSSNSSQTNASSIDIQTFVLVGLSVLIFILLILIAITIITKRRANNNGNPDTEIESAATSDKTATSRSTAYTNVAYDENLTPSTNCLDDAHGRKPTKSSELPSLSTSSQLSSTPPTSQPTCNPKPVQAINGQLENGVNFV